MTTSSRLRAAMALVLLVAVGHVQALGLRERVEALAAAHGFFLENGSRIGSEPAPPSPGEPRAALDALLANYNYVVLKGPDGGIEKVIIVGLRRAPPRAEPSNTVPTLRIGSHHVVAAVLVGPNAAPRQVSMMLDTGASTLVLPLSSARALGFDETSLHPVEVQTANGRVEAMRGLLRSVEVGGAVVADVAVTFVPDSRLSGHRLLGMSFLEHFRLTIDDANSRLILMQR